MQGEEESSLLNLPRQPERLLPGERSECPLDPRDCPAGIRHFQPIACGEGGNPREDHVLMPPSKFPVDVHQQGLGFAQDEVVEGFISEMFYP